MRIAFMTLRLRFAAITSVPLVVAVTSALVVVACGADRDADPQPMRVSSSAVDRPADVRKPVDAAEMTRPRVVFLGDSLTAGYGLAREQAVPALIQARMDREGFDYEVINAGVSGDTSAGGLSRLEWSLTGPVRVLVVELGGNDGLRGLPVASLRDNLDVIITRAKSRGISVLLTGMEAPPNYGAAYTEEFRAVFRDLARQHAIAFVPFYLEHVAGIPRLNLADGIHPNPEGARIVQETIWRALQPLLAASAGVETR
jgi:acyl-CoA thioesterase-1